MQLKFEVLLDEPDIGRIVRAGNWILTTYPDGHGEWEWEAKHEQTAARQPREISRGHQPGEAAKEMQSPPAPLLVRRTRVSLL